jgi:hypothetical protein
MRPCLPRSRSSSAGGMRASWPDRCPLRPPSRSQELSPHRDVEDLSSARSPGVTAPARLPSHEENTMAKYLLRRRPVRRQQGRPHRQLRFPQPPLRVHHRRLGPPAPNENTSKPTAAGRTSRASTPTTGAPAPGAPPTPPAASPASTTDRRAGPIQVPTGGLAVWDGGLAHRVH